MKNSKKYTAGFTLIELLVVIVIIAIISAVVLSSLASSRSKARDAKRVSDIAQIQLALEQYYDRCQKYPDAISTGSTNCSVNGTAVTLGNFISTIPVPSSQMGQTAYDYALSADKLDYILHAKLEKTSEVVIDGLASNYIGGSFSCVNTTGSTEYCVGPK